MVYFTYVQDLEKIRTSLLIIEKLKPRSVLIAYPDKIFRESWENDFNFFGKPECDIEWTTHRSIEKRVKESFDLIIIDEIHLLSDNQIYNSKKT